MNNQEVIQINLHCETDNFIKNLSQKHYFRSYFCHVFLT